MKTNPPLGEDIVAAIKSSAVAPRPVEPIPYGTPEWCQSMQDRNDGLRSEIDELRATCRFRRRLIWGLICGLICTWAYFKQPGLIPLVLIGIPILASILNINGLFSE